MEGETWCVYVVMWIYLDLHLMLRISIKHLHSSTGSDALNYHFFVVSEWRRERKYFSGFWWLCWLRFLRWFNSHRQSMLWLLTVFWLTVNRTEKRGKELSFSFSLYYQLTSILFCNKQFYVVLFNKDSERFSLIFFILRYSYLNKDYARFKLQQNGRLVAPSKGNKFLEWLEFGV